jgi:hypothetical protein
MSSFWDAFLTNESSVEEGGSVVASVAVVHSSSTNETMSDTDSMGDSTNETVSNTNSTDKAMSNTEASNNSVSDSSHQSTVSNETRGDNTDSPHPVGADAVGGAWVVSNSSDRGSESLGLGDAPVLALQRLVHRLVGHLATSNSDSVAEASNNSVTNSSDKSMSSNKAMSSHEGARSRDKTMSSNETSVSNTEVSNRSCIGRSHNSKNRGKGLQMMIENQVGEEDWLTFILL